MFGLVEDRPNTPVQLCDVLNATPNVMLRVKWIGSEYFKSYYEIRDLSFP